MSAVLVAERLHAEDDTGPSGQARGRLTGATVSLPAGIWAIIGSVEDGSVALAQAASGRRAPRSGVLTVAGRRPWKSPALRRRVGLLDLATALPPAATVAASVASAAQARGAAGDAVLEPMGLSRLAARPTASLAWSEARAVELALALATPSPVLVALVEPFADVGGVDPGRVRERLRAMADDGACVLVITSDPRGGDVLADATHLLSRGRIGTGRPPRGAAAGALDIWVGAEGAGPAGLAAALSKAEPVVEAAWRWAEPERMGVVRVRGTGLQELAQTVAAVCVTEDADVRAVRPVPPTTTEAV